MNHFCYKYKKLIMNLNSILLIQRGYSIITSSSYAYVSIDMRKWTLVSNWKLDSNRIATAKPILNDMIFVFPFIFQSLWCVYVRFDNMENLQSNWENGEKRKANKNVRTRHRIFYISNDIPFLSKLNSVDK